MGIGIWFLNPNARRHEGLLLLDLSSCPKVIGIAVASVRTAVDHVPVVRTFITIWTEAVLFLRRCRWLNRHLHASQELSTHNKES